MLQRVNIGNAKGVSHNAARGRPPAGADGDVFLAGKINKIGNN